MVLILTVEEWLMPVALCQQNFGRGGNGYHFHTSKVFAEFTGWNDQNNRLGSFALAAVAVVTHYFLLPITKETEFADKFSFLVTVHNILEEIWVDFAYLFEDCLCGIVT